MNALPSSALPSNVMSAAHDIPVVLSMAAAGTSTGVGEMAEQRLRKSPYFYLKGLSCQYARGVLTLRGTVPWGELAHVAESIVARVPGVDEVVNCVEVIGPVPGYLHSKGA